MKLLMDIQAIQSEGSRGRGIGRYSEELTKYILQNIEKKEVKLLLNGLYPEHDKSIMTDIGKSISKDNYIHYYPLNLSLKIFWQRIKYRKINSILVKKQLNQIENQEILHIHSIFEGLGGKAEMITDFSNLKSHVVVTLYDLIPLIYKEEYLTDMDTRNGYYKALRLFYEADLILAISEATKEDAINILGIPEDKIINISGAIDSKKFFKIKNIELTKHQKILKTHHITQPFILYTGGIDFRKNIGTSIEAFSKIETELFEKYQFVIVCKITYLQEEEFKQLIKHLKIPKNKIIFTGFISDEELNNLYNLAKLFIFPSIYEGFGLPILEAMSCGRAVIGSNSSSISEIIDNEESLFDPQNTQSITNKIELVLKDSLFLDKLEQHSYERAKEFSWDSSAKKAIEGYQTLLNQKKTITKKPKVAFFSPFPNKRSGISDYSLELLPFLSKYIDIDIFVDDYIIDSDYINANYNIFDYRAFELVHESYDSIIYQFGNSEYHAYMYDIALKYSGIIILHDFFLSGLVHYISHKNNSKDVFFDALIYAHGTEGEESKKRILAEENTLDSVLTKLPINKKLIDSASSIIVHSKYAKSLFKKYYSDEYNITQIEQLIQLPSLKLLAQKENHREALNIKSDEIIISVFGHITDTKQYDFILEAFVQAHIFNNQKVKLIFVGEFSSPLYQEKILSYIDRYKLQKRVIIKGFVTDEFYKKYLLVTDIAINLRVKSRGETSRALLMNMAYALPTIVNDYASFSELPDNVASKVILGSEEDFIEKIKLLIENKTRREEIAKNAYEYIKLNHRIDMIAKEYYDAVCNQMTKPLEPLSITEELANVIVDEKLDKYLSKKEYIDIATALQK